MIDHRSGETRTLCLPKLAYVRHSLVVSGPRIRPNHGFPPERLSLRNSQTYKENLQETNLHRGRVEVAIAFAHPCGKTV